MSTHSLACYDMQGMPLPRWRSDVPGLGQCIGSWPDGSSRGRHSRRDDRETPTAPPRRPPPL